MLVLASDFSNLGVEGGDGDWDGVGDDSTFPKCTSKEPSSSKSTNWFISWPISLNNEKYECEIIQEQTDLYPTHALTFPAKKVAMNKNMAFFIPLTSSITRFLLLSHFLCFDIVVVLISFDSNEVNIGA